MDILIAVIGLAAAAMLIYYVIILMRGYREGLIRFCSMLYTW